MDAVELAESRLESVYSIHQYLKDITLFDKVAKKITALPVAGEYSMQVDGRMDIVSFELYKNPLLDWVLMVFNGIKRIGTFEDVDVKETINLTLTPNERYTVEVALSHATVQIKVGEEYVEVTGPDVEGRSLIDTSGDGFNDLRITYTSSGALLENITTVGETISFVVVYPTTARDDFLEAGTEIPYPSLTDIESALRSVTETEEQSTVGFSRL